MTPQRGRSLATGPLALLLAALALLLTAGWPVREDLANDAWRSVASARSLGLFALAFAAGASLRAHPRRDLVHLLVAAVVTMPFEVAAHRGGAWQDPLAWSLGYAVALAWSVYGVTWALRAAVRRVGGGLFALALSLPIAWTLLLFVDLELGAPVFLAWVTPFIPSWTAAILAGALGLTTGVVAFGLASRPSGDAAGGAP